LEQRRHLTEGDGELLRLYAIIFDRHERALHKLDEEGEFVTAQQFGKGGIVIEVEKVNPALKVAEVCEKNLCAILDRLGLTPVNRKAVKAKSTADEPEVDPLTELMNSRRGTFIAPPASDDRLANEHTDFDS
jgi:phage terminase small subunit